MIPTNAHLAICETDAALAVATCNRRPAGGDTATMRGCLCPEVSSAAKPVLEDLASRPRLD